jgi:hypothetical protein
MAALTGLDYRSPMYVKTGSNANLSNSQANKAINYIQGKIGATDYFEQLAQIGSISNGQLKDEL